MPNNDFGGMFKTAIDMVKPMAAEAGSLLAGPAHVERAIAEGLHDLVKLAGSRRDMAAFTQAVVTDIKEMGGISSARTEPSHINSAAVAPQAAIAPTPSQPTTPRGPGRGGSNPGGHGFN